MARTRKSGVRKAPKLRNEPKVVKLKCLVKTKSGRLCQKPKHSCFYKGHREKNLIKE